MTAWNAGVEPGAGDIVPSRVRIHSARLAAHRPAARRAPSGAQIAREAVFDIRDMTVHYGDSQALGWTTLKIYRNLVTAVIGPSGCGKSTFIRSLNRMNDSIPGFRLGGDVLYHGHDVYAPATNRVEVRRRIGMVFQKPNPFPKSIYDNIAWAPRNLGMRTGLDERVERALRNAALWDEVKDRLRDGALGLSGGQQQRLCIARAIAIEPDVLLLDEPASALDPIATASIEQLMHTLKNRYTIVIVTHNMQQAARVCRPDRVLQPRRERRRAGRHARRVRRHRDDLPAPHRFPDARLRDRAVRLSPEPPSGWALTQATVAFHAQQTRSCSRRGPQGYGATIASCATCWSSGCPHCQQYAAPLECGAPHDAHAPAVEVSSRRRMRSTSASSESASWSAAARRTITSTRIRSRIAIS